jgi:hypothetical protein
LVQEEKADWLFGYKPAQRYGFSIRYSGIDTLIYARFITVLLKRPMAYSTEQIKEVWISTHKTARAASNWLTLLVNGITHNGPIPEVLAECVEIIAKRCKRACPKRDLNHGLYQFGVLPLVDIQTID